MKSKTSATLLLIFTFILGAVAGAVISHLYLSPNVAEGHRGKGRYNPHDIVEEFSQGLSLNQDQQKKLSGIIDRSRERYKTLSIQFRPQYDQIRDETRQEIRLILTEEQKGRFETIIKEMDERHKQREGRPPPMR